MNVAYSRTRDEDTSHYVSRERAGRKVGKDNAYKHTLSPHNISNGFVVEQPQSWSRAAGGANARVSPNPTNSLSRQFK